MEHLLIQEAKVEMEAVIEVVIGDLAMVKTGRARPDLLENVQVQAYDTRMPLIELSSITAPDPHMLMVQPWDESIVETVAKGIAGSDLNLNPVVDGKLIRISIPPLTEERREELVKLVGQKLESGKVLLRGARQETKKKIEDLKGEPGVSEDDIHRLMEQLEKLTEEYMDKVEKLGENKREELRTI